MWGIVTLATPMAGRGTDIRLGDGVIEPACIVPASAQEDEPYSPDAVKCCIGCCEYDEATGCAHCFKPKVDSRFPRRGRSDCRQDVPCGLHVVGAGRNALRHVDDQLRARAGRQGQPGSSRFFVSLDDEPRAPRDTPPTCLIRQDV